MQPKLKVSPPGDALEKEADHVADKVTQPSFFQPAAPPIQRVCEHCAEEEEKLQREKESGEECTVSLQASGDGDPVANDATSQAIARRKGSGAALSGSTKDFMESRFSRSFGDVRLHTDGEAAQLSDGLNAQAFTHGSDIYFNTGKFDPGSSSGRHLLAHELTHVVQQNGNNIHRIQRAPKEPDQQKHLQVWKNAMILEHAYTKVWVDHLYPGTLVKGYVRIELLNIPADVASEFLPPDVPGSDQRGLKLDMPEKGQGGLRLEGPEKPRLEGPEFNPPIEGEMPDEQPEYFELYEEKGDPSGKEPEPHTTMPSAPVAKGKGVVLRITRRISIVTRNQLKANIVMTADTDLPKSFKFTAGNSTAIVEEVLNQGVSNSSISILFNHTFPGGDPDSADPIHDQQVTSLNSLIGKYAPDLVGIDIPPQKQYNAAIQLLLTYVPYAAIALQDNSRKLKDKETKTLEEAEKHIRRQGKWDGITVQSPDGKFHTYQLTQMDMFSIVNELRANETADKLRVRSVDESVAAKKIVLDGKEMDMDEVVNNLYYPDPITAAEGKRRAGGEAIIYRMKNSGFYARKPISHDEAMTLWDKIDDEIEFPERLKDCTQVEDGTFVALYAKGTGEYHHIDAKYVEGKIWFNRNIDYFDRDVTIVDPSKPGDTGAPPLLDYLYYRNNGDKVQQYLDGQLDKGVLHDTSFRDTIKDKKYLQNALTYVMLNKLLSAGNRLALDVVTKAHAGLKLLEDDEDAFRALIIRFPDMSVKDQTEALTMLGVEEDKRDYYRKVLADKETAYQIAFGIKVKTVGMEPLRSGLQTVTKELGTVKEQIRSGQLQALMIDGDFGNVIRERVYQDFGFTRLTADSFPHRGQTSGVFPTPLSGNAMDYSGLYEQIYANYTAHSANASVVMKVAIITGMALVTAAIVILSGGIGAGVAAIFFTEGTAAFMVTSVAVSALSMTIMGEAFSQALGAAGIGQGGALGKDGGIKELGKTFLENLALSFIFSGIGRMMKNAGAVWRISVTGGAFIGYSLGRRVVTGQGLPKGEEIPLFIYEQLVTLAAIEAGGVLARTLTEGMYTKGLSARVGIINKKITVLRGEISTSQTRLAELLAKGDTDTPTKVKFLSEQRVLLEKYAAVLREIKAAKDVQYERDVDSELLKVETAVEKIKIVEFQQKIGFKQNEFAGDKISYKPGDKAVKDIKEYYGKENVTGPDGDGMLKVKTPDGRELTFYPETKEKQVNRTILERPATKLEPDVPHSVDVRWNNIDTTPGLIILKGSKYESTAKDFWNETGPNMYDQVYAGEYYIKYETTQGRLLIGEVQTGRILGFYLDEGRLYPTKYTKTLVNDPMKDMGIAVEKLMRYHGLKDQNVPLAGKFSSKASIVAHPDKTTTILGAYVAQDGKITYTDMPQLFDNFGNLKTADFGAKKGGFNVLNVGEGFYEPGTFFQKYNRPWLEEAIKRDDIFYVASDPTKEIFIFERDKGTGDWVYTDPPANTVRKRTGFGKEVQILEQNGYTYDPATKTYKK